MAKIGTDDNLCAVFYIDGCYGVHFNAVYESVLRPVQRDTRAIGIGID